MIVRISGLGQYELDDAGAHRLSDIDDRLSAALQAGQNEEFHRHLHEAISFVRENGKEVGPETIVPSDVIIPPDDVTLEEARKFFTDEGLMQPLPA